MVSVQCGIPTVCTSTQLVQERKDVMNGSTHNELQALLEVEKVESALDEDARR